MTHFKTFVNFLRPVRTFAVLAFLALTASQMANAFVAYNVRGEPIAISGGNQICPVWGCDHSPISEPIQPVPPIHVCPVWGCNGPEPIRIQPWWPFPRPIGGPVKGIGSGL